MARRDSLTRRALLAAAGTAAAGALAGCTSGGPRRVHPDVDVVTAERATAEVTSLGGLRDALGSASAGDVVYVPPTETIDLTGEWLLEVPSGVTLAGGRGQPGPKGPLQGALLRSSDGDESPDGETSQKFLLADGARFTGFRLRGHHHDYVNPVRKYDGDFYAHRGGGVKAEGKAEVDNNEIYDWVHAAVATTASARVHHNHVHHNCWEGLGYGVAVGHAGRPVIEHNYFNYNRHAISGEGHPETAYVARYNVCGPDWVGPQFDVHGTEGTSGVAGRRFEMAHNTFCATYAVNEVTGSDDPLPAIYVRGTPKERVAVRNNWFYHRSRDGAYLQTGGPHEVTFSGNHYGRLPPGDEDVGAPRSHDGLL